MTSSSGVAIVTGANGIFGRWIASGLVSKGYETVCVVRDKVKGQALVEKLERENPSAKVRFALVDCSSHSSIKAFADSWSGGPVEILVNNAVITPTERKETADGIEAQFATNVLNYHWFTKEFERHFMPNKARVNFVASFYAGELQLDDVEFKKRKYDANEAYRASKQADRMLASVWAEKLKEKGITVTSSHPGVATSNCSLGLGFDISRDEKDQKAGAVTPLFCVLTEGTKLKSGGYYADSKLEKCSFCQNKDACQRLWDIVESYP